MATSSRQSGRRSSSSGRSGSSGRSSTGRSTSSRGSSGGSRSSHGYSASGRGGSSSRSSSSSTRGGSSMSRSGTSRRGFASMDPEEQREIASMGGRASHGGRGANYRSSSQDDEYEDQDYSSPNFDDDRGYSVSGQSDDDYEDESYSTEDDDYQSEERNQRRNGGSSRRGFAAMDPQMQRRIAAKGGRASHGGRGTQYRGSRSRSHQSNY